MNHLKESIFAIVDIETTGSSPIRERVIEIGILRVENGKVTKKYQKLIDPQKYLPPSIQDITGIRPNDLVGAPLFEDIAQEVHELLNGAIFVAHNVRFDYGFIKNELKRSGIIWNAKCLCTVRLSRKLFKKYKHHDLSSIIDRYGFTCENRHRAYDDAAVLWDFMNMIVAEGHGEKMNKAIDELLQTRTLPQFLDEKSVSNLPSEPGVYIFYGPDDEVLYVGKSRNLKYRVMSHFANDHREGKEMNICQQTKRVEVRETSGELGALLLESELVKKYSPLYNRMLRRSSELVLAKRRRTDSYHEIFLERSSEIVPQEYKDTLGVFKNMIQAKEFLKGSCDEWQLCPKLMGIEKSKGACFYSQLGKCKGACKNKDNADEYNLRLAEAFASRRLKAWPFDGAIIIDEKRDDMEKHSFVLDNWCLIANIKTEEDGVEFVSHSPKFDYDSYKIFARYLSDPAHKRNIKPITKRELASILHNESVAESEEYLTTII
ncbi:MAG: exonuclease domain-containing protein [Patescibacteria group bacterium]